MSDLYASNIKHRKDFKKVVSAEDNRRRREEVSIRLRKEKKEESIAKRRNIYGAAAASSDAPAAPEPTPQQVIAETGTLDSLIQGLQTQDLSEIIRCVRGIRKQLSVEKNPPVNEVVSKGVLPFFVACLGHTGSTELQFEAAWALTNIASTEFTRTVVENNAVGPLVQLLQSHVPDIREQAAWCLGNIAGDCADLRDIVLAANPFPALIANINQPASLSLLRNVVWTVSNLCRGKPAPATAAVAPVLPYLAQLISNDTDRDVAADSLWALSYLSDGDEKCIQRVVDLGVAPRLVELLKTPCNLQVPALRTLGNFVSGTVSQTQIALDAGLLPAIAPLLQKDVRRGLRKEACWVLSNIAAGSPAQLLQLLADPAIMSLVMRQLNPSVEWDVRKEASWVLCNAVTSAKRDSLVKLMEQGAVQTLASLLDVSDAKIILLALESLEIFLKLGESLSDPQVVVQLLTDCGGADALEALQEHAHQEVYSRAVKLIERFFATEEEDEDGENQPASNTVFQFGTTPSTSTDLQKPFQFSFGSQPSQGMILPPQGTHTRFAF